MKRGRYKNRNKLDNRGSQVAIILSFVIFFFFLIFLIFFLNVFRGNTGGSGNELIVRQIQQRIMEQSTADLTTYSIGVSRGVDEDCVSIDNPFQGQQGALMVKDEKKNNVPNEISNGRIIMKGTDKRFYKMAFSKQLFPPGGSPGCSDVLDLNEGDFRKGLLKTIPYVFESGLEEIIDNYPNNKDSIGVPSDKNIAFGLIMDLNEDLKDINPETGVVLYKSPPQGVEVFSDQIPIQYVDLNADVKSAWLQVMIW
jgi:hypothetical protein